MHYMTVCGRLAAATIFSLLVCATTAQAQVTVHGTVTRADTGAPMQGITITIGSPSITGGYYAIATRITGTDGSYDWTGTCNVFNPPYSRCRVQATSAGYADNKAYFEPATAPSFVLDLSMHASTTISGKVRNAADGTPAEGIPVRLTCAQSDVQTCEPSTATHTDGDGNYAISGLPGGSYRLCAGALEANTIAQCHDHFNHGALADDQAYTPVVVADGEARTSVDFNLAAGGSILGTLHDGYANAVLHDPSLALEVYDANGNLFGGTTMTTDDSGTYAVHGLPNGSFYLAATIFGPWMDGRQVYPNLACDSQGNCPSPNSGQPLVIGSATTISGIDFTVHPFSVITGFVHAATDGAPLGGIPVRAELCGWMGSGCFAYADQAVSVADTGSYTIYTSELHDLYVATDNLSPYIDQVYPSTPCLSGNACTTTGAAFSTARGSVFSNVDFYLVRGSTISGHVDSHGGTGTSIVSIYDANRHQLASGYADANGQYTTPAWLPGTYFVEAELGSACIFYSAQRCLYGDQDPASFQPTPLDLSAGETRTGIDFTLYPTDLVFHDGFGAQ